MECMKDRFHEGQLLDGRFRALAPLNHGSFGMVFLAEDLVTGQEVAIKCLTKPSAAPMDGPTTADEGADELACHAILKYHPHLVNLVHHFETKAHTYLVLEYCSQGDLYEAIRAGHGPLQTQHVRKFMLQLISAVEHMHINGLYHRDIKPENIFITADGNMKLGDFGLATRSLWSYESCVGSDRYMAPEQYDHAGNGYNPAKADIWSIGVCLLNILFARNPFVTPTESDVLFSDYVRDRQSLFDIFPNMSQDTFEILAVAMAVDPNKRDLHALRFALQRTLSFTIDDDDNDAFCVEERDEVRVSADREPLRTPSIQSPAMDGDSFPWAKITSPVKPTRQLSTVPDDYEEDLFAPSERGRNLGTSWLSGHFNTPSTTSVLSSTFSSHSFRSNNIFSQAIPARRAKLPTIPSSLPTQKTRPIPALSSFFGKKDSVAKSWSDMWEEDEELEQEAEFRARREFNSRSFSNEVITEESDSVTLMPEVQPMSTPGRPQITRKLSDPVIGPKLEGTPAASAWSSKTPKRSPKECSVDKWSELGNRRRQPTVTEPPSSLPARKIPGPGTKKRTTSTLAETPYHRRQSRNKSGKSRPAYLDQDWRQRKVIDSDDDHEWVGGWDNFHL